MLWYVTGKGEEKPAVSTTSCDLCNILRFRNPTLSQRNQVSSPLPSPFRHIYNTMFSTVALYLPSQIQQYGWPPQEFVADLAGGGVVYLKRCMCDGIGKILLLGPHDNESVASSAGCTFSFDQLYNSGRNIPAKPTGKICLANTEFLKSVASAQSFSVPSQQYLFASSSVTTQE